MEIRNSIDELRDCYGILTTKEKGKIYFNGVWRILAQRLSSGDDEIYKKVSMLMEDVEKNYSSYVEEDNRVVIEAPRHLLVFYPSEIIKLAQSDEELYIKGLKRGKSELRYRANEQRCAR